VVEPQPPVYQPQPVAQIIPCEPGTYVNIYDPSAQVYSTDPQDPAYRMCTSTGQLQPPVTVSQPQPPVYQPPLTQVTCEPGTYVNVYDPSAPVYSTDPQDPSYQLCPTPAGSGQPPVVITQQPPTYQPPVYQPTPVSTPASPQDGTCQCAIPQVTTTQPQPPVYQPAPATQVTACQPAVTPAQDANAYTPAPAAPQPAAPVTDALQKLTQNGIARIAPLVQAPPAPYGQAGQSNNSAAAAMDIFQKLVTNIAR
jgi:hypothetical protein